MEQFYDKVSASAAYIRAHIPQTPTVGIILGSGLGGLVDAMTDKTVIPYGDIPHFPCSTVAGHAGNLVIGRLGSQVAAALQGRFHYYEGFSMKEVTYPVYVLALLGVKTLIVTNACGGINRTFVPGDLMLLSDHINMLGANSLIGPNDERFGPRFPDMTEAYPTACGRRPIRPPERWASRARRVCTLSSPVRAMRRQRRYGPMSTWALTPSVCPPYRKSSPPTIWVWRCWASPASPTWPPASPGKSTPIRRCCVSPTRAARSSVRW